MHDSLIQADMFSEVSKNQYGSVSAIYQKDLVQDRLKLTSIKFTNLENITTPISLANIWLNHQPCESIHGFKWFVLKDFKFTKKEQDFFFECTDCRNWVLPKSLKVVGVVHISISFRGEKKAHLTALFSSLKILGLKKYIQNKFGINEHYKTHTPFKAYFLFYKHFPLNDSNTLEECGLKDGEEIEFSLHETPVKTSKQLQIHTGGEYNSVTAFKDYYSTMVERIQLVCLVTIKARNSKESGTGTGFLIGDGMIITNEHVISESKFKTKSYESLTATFFYEERKEGQQNEEIHIPLIAQKNGKPFLDIVHSSPRLPIWKSCTIDGLDFTIIRFPTGWDENPKAAKALRSLSKTAKFFFQNPVIDEYQEEIYQKWKSAKANVIQHPNSMVKQIAFRHNRVNQVEQFLIHYESKTSGGSSGSPVTTDEGKWMGLHASACGVLEQNLFVKLEVLLKTLPLGSFKKEGNKYCNFQNRKGLEVYFKGDFKGVCKEGEEQYSLLELIEKTGVKPDKQEEVDPEQKPRAWAFEFLVKNGILIDEKHKYCNTAINPVAIFQNLTKYGKLEKIQQTQEISVQREWRIPVFRKLKQICAQIMRSSFFTATGSLAIVIIIYFGVEKYRPKKF